MLRLCFFSFLCFLCFFLCGVGDLLRGGDKCGGDHFSRGDIDLDLLRWGEDFCSRGGDKDGDLLDRPAKFESFNLVLTLFISGRVSGEGECDMLLSLDDFLLFLLLLFFFLGEGDFSRVLGDLERDLYLSGDGELSCFNLSPSLLGDLILESIPRSGAGISGSILENNSLDCISEGYAPPATFAASC